MNEPKRERWQELAEEVLKERDTEKMFELANELDRALAERDSKKSQGGNNSAA